MKRQRLYSEYSDHVWVVYDCTRQQYAAFLKRKHGKDAPDDEDGFYRGCVDEIEHDDQPSCFYLWIEERYASVTLLTIIHETSHLVYRLLKYAGVKLNDKTEEVFAYLQESFCKQILKRRR